VSDPERPAGRRNRWLSWLAPIAAGLVIGGVIAGISVWRTHQDSETQLNRLLDTASSTYQQQAERQGQIDQLYAPCSERWIQETTDNAVESMQTLVTLRDAEAFAGEGRALMQQLCTDGDIEAYCKAYAQVLLKWAVGDIGDAADIEQGCLKRNAAQ